MEDVLITKKNIDKLRDQDLKAMELYLFESEDAMIDTTPIKLTQQEQTMIEKIKYHYTKITTTLKEKFMSFKTEISNLKVEISTRIYNTKISINKKIKNFLQCHKIKRKIKTIKKLL